MAANSSNSFDCLPNELIEYIFLSVLYPIPIESFNHVNHRPSVFYFSHTLHEPYLRQTFKDLTSLERVCRRFYNILRTPTFWIRKCQCDDVSLVNTQLAISSNVDFRRLYFSNPFHPDYNRLDFDNNNKIIDRYEQNENWGPGVALERTPIGSDLLYDAFGLLSSCYATSYSWGQYQRNNIQLLRKGEENLVSINPVIEFTVCIAGRRDCSSICHLELNFSNSHIWNYQRTFSNGDCHWHRITYRYVNYLKEEMPSHVSIVLKGKDSRFWAGHYGTKFAQIKLKLALRQENENENQVFEETITGSHISNSLKQLS